MSFTLLLYVFVMSVSILLLPITEITLAFLVWKVWRWWHPLPFCCCSKDTLSLSFLKDSFVRYRNLYLTYFLSFNIFNILSHSLSWKTSVKSCIYSIEWIPLYLTYIFSCLFILRKRESMGEKERQRERGREGGRGVGESQAGSCTFSSGTDIWAGSHEPWVHDLSWNQELDA